MALAAFVSPGLGPLAARPATPPTLSAPPRGDAAPCRRVLFAWPRHLATVATGLVAGAALRRRRGAVSGATAPRSRVVAAAAVSDTLGPVKQRLAEMRELRARDLKQQLMNLGANVSACLDKESLLDVLDREGEWLLMKKGLEQDTKAAKAREKKRLEREKAADAVMGDEDPNWQPEEVPEKCLRRMEEVYEAGKLRRGEVHKARRKNYTPYKTRKK
mmetsp:Transcript_5042/g.13015  ORF Transcript_5042/g.13015 Transcript_5042/m.13015 type:complete len:217 (+) Transcript_5042:24-674(+)